MAQKRYLEYKDPVDSFDANRKYLGILPSGRYRGFDTMVPASALSFDLKHDVTGVVMTEEDATEETDPVGVIVTPAGTIIHEDADITAAGAYSTLAIDTNSGNAATRYDLVICEHEYINSVGGQNAQYSIVKGPLGSATVPAIPNTKTQVLIGILEIPAGATTLSTVTWTPSVAPQLGDEPNLRLNEINQVNKAIGFKSGTVAADVVGDDVYLEITNNGSVYQANWNSLFAAVPAVATKLFSGTTPLGAVSQIRLVGDFPSEAEIKVYFFGLNSTNRTAFKLRNLSSAIADGSILTVWNRPVDDTMLIYDGAWVTFKKLGTTWGVIGVTYGDIVNQLYESTLPQALMTGEIKMWPKTTAPTGWLALAGGTIGNSTSGGTILADDTAEDLYLFLWNNFADGICPVFGGRGVSATADYAASKAITLPDFKGKVPVMYNNSETEFNAIGKQGGEKTHLLTAAESGLPEHTHAQAPSSNGTGTGGAEEGGAFNGNQTSGVVGGAQPAASAHNNLQPYFTVNFIIKL